MRQVDLCIDLCRGKGTVAEELLDRAKVHSRLQKMGGECVTQRVRVEMVEIRREAHGAVELPADGPITEAAPALIDKQWFALVGDPSTPIGAVGKIYLEGLRSRPAERDEAHFAPFASHPNNPLTELDITKVEGHEFADAKPCGVKKLHRCAVTAPRRGVGKSFKKFLDCVAFGNLGCSMDIAWVGDRVCRRYLEGALDTRKRK